MQILWVHCVSQVLFVPQLLQVQGFVGFHWPMGSMGYVGYIGSEGSVFKLFDQVTRMLGIHVLQKCKNALSVSIK